MKSESRVKNYKPGSEDWKAEYDMLLDDGITCNDCVHVNRCCLLFGQSPYVNEGKCQFYPNRFYPKNIEAPVEEEVSEDKVSEERDETKVLECAFCGKEILPKGAKPYDLDGDDVFYHGFNA